MLWWSPYFSGVDLRWWRMAWLIPQDFDSHSLNMTENHGPALLSFWTPIYDDGIAHFIFVAYHHSNLIRKLSTLIIIIQTWTWLWGAWSIRAELSVAYRTILRVEPHEIQMPHTNPRKITNSIETPRKFPWRILVCMRLFHGVTFTINIAQSCERINLPLTYGSVMGSHLGLSEVGLYSHISLLFGKNPIPEMDQNWG